MDAHTETLALHKNILAASFASAHQYINKIADTDTVDKNSGDGQNFERLDEGIKVKIARLLKMPFKIEFLVIFIQLSRRFNNNHLPKLLIEIRVRHAPQTHKNQSKKKHSGLAYAR